MRLTITTLNDDIYNIEVSDDMELENFKALCEFESNIPASEIALLWNGRPLQNDKQKLKDYGITDGDMLLLQRMQRSGQRRPHAPAPRGGAAAGGLPMIDFSGIAIPGSSNEWMPHNHMAAPGSSSQGLPDDPATLRELLLASPHEIALLKERNPPLAEALMSGSLDKFTEVLRKQQSERADKERDRIRLLTADPFDAEAQKQIAEEIRLKNVESNMETAMEFAPESFGQVVMLYIDCSVNGHPVKAFVDSGAQMTIMSRACAERCNINRLVDTRWAGIAKGVGTQKIIGRVHLCQIQIGDDFLQSSFSILEDQPMDMLLGLDMLKRHQCCLDLKRNRLVIGTTGKETPFLSESELPEHARLNRSQSETSQVDEDKQLAEALTRSAADASAKSASKSPNSLNPGHTSHSTQPATTPQQQSASPQQHASFPEADIQRLINNGFSRERVIQELVKAKGNVDLALMALIATSINFPS